MSVLWQNIPSPMALCGKVTSLANLQSCPPQQSCTAWHIRSFSDVAFLGNVHSLGETALFGEVAVHSKVTILGEILLGKNHCSW